MRIVGRLLKEFWLPAVIALVWTGINLIGYSKVDWSVVRVINIFAPTFFLVSWLTAQYFRISRQAKVEDDLESIRSKIGGLLDEFQTKTQNILGQITGGDSFCYLMIGAGQSPVLATIVHKGDHPLYDVVARIVDLEAYHKIDANLTFQIIQKTDIYRTYGTLIPGYCKVEGEWNLGDGDCRSFNIFWTARNGGFTQRLRLRRVENKWYHATVVHRGKVIFEQIQEGFPRNEKGEVEW
jgi:hypothetical protein